MLHKTKFLSRVSTQWQRNMGTVIFINWWCNICNISLLWWVMNSWPKKAVIERRFRAHYTNKPGLCNNVWGLESLNPDDKQNQSSQEISCRCNYWGFNVFFPHSEATQCISQCILHYIQCRYFCIMQLLRLLEFA